METAADTDDCDTHSSRWIHMHTTSSEGHWIPEQGLEARRLVEELTAGDLRRNGQPRVFVITPFKLVAEQTRELFRGHFNCDCSDMVGTVHTFQGKEADNVILLLCGDPLKPGVITRFAGAKPNQVNVAVTRAKRTLYVVGDLNFWTGPADVQQIYARLAMKLAQ